MPQKHPFEATREKAGELLETIKSIRGVVEEGRQKGLQTGPFSRGAAPQMRNRSIDDWLLLLESNLKLVHGARTRSPKQKDLFQALFFAPVTTLAQHLPQLPNQLRQIVQQAEVNPSQANQSAANFLSHQMSNQANLITAAMDQIGMGLPHVVSLQAKPDAFHEMAERLQALEDEAESLVRRLAEMEKSAGEKVRLIEEHLPEAEALAEEIRKVTAILARDLASDVDAETLPLREAIRLLGEHLTALRKVLEEREEKSEKIQAELEELRRQAAQLEEKATKLLARSEEVLGHAEGTGLAKWFKQAHEEYDKKLSELRIRFNWVAIVVIFGAIVYAIGLPFLLTLMEAFVRKMGWDGNLLVTLFTRLTLATPITVAFFYLWRVYNEYATTERLAHRYRHWQALGASLGGFRMLTGEEELSDKLTAATFMAVIEDPLKDRPASNEELNFLQRILGVRFRRKTAASEEEMEAGVLPKKS